MIDSFIWPAIHQIVAIVFIIPLINGMWKLTDITSDEEIANFMKARSIRREDSRHQLNARDTRSTEILPLTAAKAFTEDSRW